MQNISDIVSQTEPSFFQEIFELIKYYLPYLIPPGGFVGFLLTKRVSCKYINTVLHIQKNLFTRLDTYEISNPIIAVLSDKIKLPINIKNPNIFSPDTDRRNIWKIRKNIVSFVPWRLERSSKTIVKILYEWFPEKREIYFTNQDETQVHPQEIITNYTVTNCSDYNFQNLELCVNLPLNTDIDLNNFNPKFLEIIDVANNNQKIQKRATKISLLKDGLVDKFEVSWEAEIESKKTKTFEIHYKLNNV